MLARTDQLTIRAWYGFMPTDILARKINKPVEAVDAEAERMGLRGTHRGLREMADAARCRAELNAEKPKPVRHVAADKRRQRVERVNQIIDEFPTTPNVILASRHGYSMSRISQIARQYGLQKAAGCRTVGVSPELRCTRKPTVKAVREAYNALKQGDTLTALHILESFFKKEAA